LINLLSLFNKHHQHHIKILVAITVMGMVGIEMTSFCLSLVRAGLAIGLAAIWNKILQEESLF
jgi:uncharacterized membrane protein YjgN (DUF898 family)